MQNVLIKATYFEQYHPLETFMQSSLGPLVMEL